MSLLRTPLNGEEFTPGQSFFTNNFEASLAGSRRKSSSMDKFLDMRQNRAAERLQVVATLETRDDAALTNLGRPGFHIPGHFHKVHISEHELTQGITQVGIKAGRNNYEVGFELLVDFLEPR